MICLTHYTRYCQFAGAVRLSEIYVSLGKGAF